MSTGLPVGLVSPDGAWWWTGIDWARMPSDAPHAEMPLRRGQDTELLESTDLGRLAGQVAPSTQMPSTPQSVDQASKPAPALPESAEAAEDATGAGVAGLPGRPTAGVGVVTNVLPKTGSRGRSISRPALTMGGAVVVALVAASGVYAATRGGSPGAEDASPSAATAAVPSVENSAAAAPAVTQQQIDSAEAEYQTPAVDGCVNRLIAVYSDWYEGKLDDASAQSAAAAVEEYGDGAMRGAQEHRLNLKQTSDDFRYLFCGVGE